MTKVKPTTTTWVPDVAGSGFDVDHLPYGSVDVGRGAVPAVRVGAYALDLEHCHRAGLLPDGAWTGRGNVDGLLEGGPALWQSTRDRVQELLAPPHHGLVPADALHALTAVRRLHLPFTVGDYVDFYSSIHHASNVGRIFRPDADPLLPNWRHLPVGYHGRSSTVVVSGSDVVRPRGQRRPVGDGRPPVEPTAQLDFELEVGFVTGGLATTRGTPLAIDQAGNRIFGIMLLNDWSARDIQAWEYQPLGPFLGKSFATSIAGWVTPMAALSAAVVPAPPLDPPPVDYLSTPARAGLDLTLEVAVTPAGSDDESVITRVGFADMYWTPREQLAHVTVGGAVIGPGDLFGSGTVSGPERGTAGCLLEATFAGTEPLLVSGYERTYLEDGDKVRLRGHCTSPNGGLLTLADVVGTILPNQR